MLFRKSNRKNKKSQTFNSQETFILEPILTPSGFVDTGDDQPDPVTFENIDLQIDIDQPENLLDSIDHSIADLPDQDPLNLDTDLEEIPFITIDHEFSSPESIEITHNDLTLDQNPENIDHSEVLAEPSIEEPTVDLGLSETSTETDLKVENNPDLLLDLSENSSDHQNIEEIETPVLTLDDSNQPDSQELESPEHQIADASIGLETDLSLEDHQDSLTDAEPVETEELVTENHPLETTETISDSEIKPLIDSPEKTDSVQIELAIDQPIESEPNLDHPLTEDLKSDPDQTVESVTEALLETPAENHLLETNSESQVIDAIANSQPDFQFDSGVFTVGETGEVTIDYLFDGGKYKGELAIFSLEGMEQFEPGSSDFIKEAASRALSDSEFGHIVISDITQGAKFSGNLSGETNWNSGEYVGLKTVEMRPGDTFGIMLVPNGKVQQVLNNPDIDGATKPLFSLATANPDDGLQVGQIADINGEGNTFAMEDLRIDQHTDKDYNDIIFQVRGAKGEAVHLDEVINPQKDWRSSDLGQALIDYAEPYINTEEPEIINEFEDIVGDLINNLDDLIQDNQDIRELDTEVNLDSTIVEKPEQEAESLIEPENIEQPAPINSEDLDVNSEPENTEIENPISESDSISNRENSDSEIGGEQTDELTQPNSVETPASEDLAETPIVPANESSSETVDNTTQNLTESEKQVITSDNQVIQPPTPVESTWVSRLENITQQLKHPTSEKISVNSTLIQQLEHLTDQLKTQNDLTVTSQTVQLIEQLETQFNLQPILASESFEFPTENQPLVGVIDTGFSSHNPDLDYSKITWGSDRIEGDNDPTVTTENSSDNGTLTLEIIAAKQNNNIGINGINDNVSIWAGRADSSNYWADSLVEFVDVAKASEQVNAVVNLNLELSPVNSDGSYQLTSPEINAIQYAQTHNIIVVVSAGEQPGTVAALGELSQEFDNIITVGSAERVNNAIAFSKAYENTPNSGTGEGLNIVADSRIGNTTDSSVATAKVTGAMSQVWAANPDLSYRQVINIIESTATDLKTPGWDNQTGNGLLNLDAAVHLAKATTPEYFVPTISNPVADIALPAQTSQTIDLSQVFTTSKKGEIKYEVMSGNSNSLTVQLEGNQLKLESLSQTGNTAVTVQAINNAGITKELTFNVTTNATNPVVINSVKENLNQLETLMNSTPDFLEGLSTDEATVILDQLMQTLEENSDLIRLLTQPDLLPLMGFDTNQVSTINSLLNSPELAEEFGLSVSLREALSQPDSTLFDQGLLNADEAVYLLPENTQQPQVGFIDFKANNHVKNVTSIFTSINPEADYDTFTVTDGNWAEKLTQFVNNLRASGQQNGVVNLSLDLSQLDDVGVTTRYELTPQEQQAIQYARDNNVLLIVASGNTGDVMSALGQASQTFDNIITVGAINQFEGKTDYSAYGDGLTVVAPGGEWQDDQTAFVGTSRSTAYVTAAVSLIWAANPALNWQQVKELLIETSRDINTEGWDKQTGYGIIDIKEAIRRSLITEPKTAETQDQITLIPFSGEGRVQTLARAAGDNTEQAISDLETLQETLVNQWQTLLDLGNPELTLTELDAEVKAKITAAFEQYQQVNTDAAISTAQAQQWTEALALATQHYQIEATRLQNLLIQQQQLQEQLASLGEQKTTLEAETQQLLATIQENIQKAEEDLAKAKAKLINPFADVDNQLQIDPQVWETAANTQQISADKFNQAATVQNTEAQRYNAIANHINPTRWQVVGTEKRRCGGTQEIWGYGTDPNLLKQKQQNQWQAQIAAQNAQNYLQLAQQAQQQSTALNQYAEFLKQQSINAETGEINDAKIVLELLQQQLAEQEKLNLNYNNLAGLAGGRQAQNQNTANWHQSQINRWEQVGTKRTGKSGRKTEPVYGWVHYPQHIAPYQQAQHQANLAANERNIYQQLASQSEQQVNLLRQQVQKLTLQIRDWPVLKQGIEYEIAADELRLQANQDLLALHEPVQEQKLETLNLLISQAETELQTLENQKIPPQEQLTNQTETRLQDTLQEVTNIQTKRAEDQQNLQKILELSGFLLPYRERLTAMGKTVQQLEAEQLEVALRIQQLNQENAQTPSQNLSQQIEYWTNHLETLNQELEWAKLQQDQLALAVADSPERLAISQLIKDLETAPNSIDPQGKIATLKSYESGGANFLAGFDHLSDRLTSAKAEQTATETELKLLQEEYRNLGLQKADLEDVKIPAKEQEIGAKEQDIIETKATISQTENTLETLEDQLPALQVSLVETLHATSLQEEAIADIQTQITDTQNQITANNNQVQELQSVLQGYQNQINQANAVVNSLEQQRLAHQNAANYWNGQIQTWGITGYDSKGRPQYGWIYNPQAEANRNASQAAANSYAQQRNTAQANAQQLTATLQPKIAETQQQIATLGQEKQALIQQQSTLNNQLNVEIQALTSLQGELQAITNQINDLQEQINATQAQLDSFNTQLVTQEQQLDTLILELAQLYQQKADFEQKLIEKYREIELTEQYLEQVNGEANRLQSRLDLLNQAGILEEKYQQNWQQWQQANQTQATATEKLLEIRQNGEPYRQQLASLGAELTDAQGKLNQANSLQQGIAEIQQSIAFINLQIGNQALLQQSLNDHLGTLAATERAYLNQAANHQQKIWYWNGAQWAYNAAEAAAYRANLQQASFIADQRNRSWQQLQQSQTTLNTLNQQLSTKNTDLINKQTELTQLGQSIPQLQVQIAQLGTAINTVNQQLEPLVNQENEQATLIENAITTSQTLATELTQTSQLHATALRQLIGLGMLASESDVDFFATQVEPQVKTHLEQLQNVANDLQTQTDNLNQLIASSQEKLANTTDLVSQAALNKLIENYQKNLQDLEGLKTANQTNTDELQGLLNQAVAALTPLRQKQELEIRQKLINNDQKLEALQSQLNSEEAADAAIQSGTVLDYVQLTQQINQDLRLGVSDWTEQFVEGNQQTKSLINQQQTLSNSVDDLITYINDNLAEPYGQYNRTEANLEDAITTLGVVEIRSDQLDNAVISTEQAIERLKLRIQQDAELWEEIEPIAIRYGVESEELKEYQAQVEAIYAETSQTNSQIEIKIKALRAQFLQEHPDNGTAIDLLKAATLEGQNSNETITALLNTTQAAVLLSADSVDGRNPLQALFDKAKAEKASHEAQGYALLAQANWYEQRAAYHWAVSRKNGPTWTEQRWVKGRSGKGHWETVTHVDYNWILWQQYSQLFPQLRAQGSAHLVEADKWRQEIERLEPLKNQWVAANDAANTAESPIDEARNLFAELEAARESIPGDQIQLTTLENLLPTIQQLLEEAEAEATAQNAKVQQEWAEYDTNSEEYRAAIADILQRRGELNTKAIETQQQLADAEATVERQTVALSDELQSTKVLTTNLEQQRQAIENQIITLQNQGVTGEELDNFNTNLVQINQSLKLLNNKAAVLTAEQTALTQKRTMLTAQNEVILAEQRLLDAYINDPDADYSNLQQQLDDARAALAEAQRLAEQAEAASQALTASLQQLKTDLLAQNDQHLKAAREHQTILKDLVEATQSNANYTLQAAQKQQEVNTLEFQILQRLQTATAAGYQEAKALLDVAQRNDMATAAEIYYRDYKDLASDRGGCAGGAGNANDQILADQYYQQMLQQRELQRRAQAQADAFGAARRTAEAQMKTLQTQQETAQQLLNDLNAKVAETQEERENKTQELAIAQARLDGITRIREQTEQTFIQLVTLEKLNLAQAQLEQEIAQNRQVDIDQAVQNRLERDRLELERKWLETTAKIEQLKQLQAEDDLRQSLNNVRGDLGLETLDPTEDPMQLQTQLAGLLTSLKDLETQQPDLPDDVKALLAEARGDINLALQGKVQEVSKANLTSALEALIIQGNLYRSQLDQIIQEEEADFQLLQDAQDDIQFASKQFLEEIDESKLLDEEKKILTPLAIESIAKVAYANQAVSISKELAQEAKNILEEILDYRKKEREQRKKAFWQMILNIGMNVLSIISLIVAPFAPIVALGLNLVKGVISTVMAAINGDWMGAIFSGVMTAASFVSGALGNIINKAGNCICVFGTSIAKSTLQNIKNGIDALKNLATGAYNGAKSIMSGDKILGALQILGGLAGAATTGLGDAIKSLPGGDMIFKVIKELEKTPIAILNGIRTIQSGDTFNGISSILGAVLSTGKNLTEGTGPDCNCDGEEDSASFAYKLFSTLGNINSSASVVVNKFIGEGGVNGWLTGIGDLANIWKADLGNLIQNSNLSAGVKNFASDTLQVLSEAPQKISQGINYIKDKEYVKGIGTLLDTVLSSAKTYADETKAAPYVNAVSNIGYTGIALATVIDGAKDGFKELLKSLPEAADYLKKAWSDEYQKSELHQYLDGLLSKFNTNVKAGSSLKDKFEALKNAVKSLFSDDTLKAIGNTIDEFLDSLVPWNQPAPIPVPATP
ncbi:putative Subtilisin [Planktothrix serta PCC 8927]|uniref:Subtilisin n=1 Tax=Planktothrix serta PCC 8927 TaxID=671068 RepID=A0A7Z9BXL4_9CYAN|nr:S8 family serine peptidase [Planktothrix serta]VXD24083.1 putative Subtilisin [Planktothrix serta PCC 8927]